VRVKGLIGGLVVLIVCYVALFGSVIYAMRQPPERFGAFMRRMPGAVVFGALPAERMWLWARKGRLTEGELAPDFSLRTVQDKTHRVTLSAYRGSRPVVLVFGSYT
jgi:hypothetical protein